NASSWEASRPGWASTLPTRCSAPWSARRWRRAWPAVVSCWANWATGSAMSPPSAWRCNSTGRERMLLEALAELQDVATSTRQLQADVDRAAALMVETLEAGGKILACGNGGSAAEAQHFVTELVGRYKSNRRP